ncbi:MAG: two-component regulator propeller domain-containing protein [Bacteroidota bacterium]
MSTSLIGVCLFFVLGPRESHAQSYRLMHFSLTDGLPSNTIYEMAEDHRGYMWLGTEGGLCRFDGERFRSYFHQALRDIEIIRVNRSPEGRVGFVNLSGQIGFIEQDSIRVLEDFGMKGKAVLDYLEDNEGNIWVGLLREKVNLQPNRVAVFRLDQAFNVLQEYPFFGEAIRVMGWNPLRNEFMIDAESGAWIHFPTIQDSFVQLNKYQHYPPKLHYDDKGFLFVEIRPSRLGSIRGTDVNYIDIDPRISPSYAFLDIEQDSDGIYWLATSNGVYKCKMEDLKLTVIEHQILVGKQVNCLTFDKEGNLWMGTEKEGIYILPRNNYRQWDGNSVDLGDFRSRLLSLDSENRVWAIANSGSLIQATDTSFTSFPYLPSGDYKGAIEGPEKEAMIYGNSYFWVVDASGKKSPYPYVYRLGFSRINNLRNVKTVVKLGDEYYGGHSFQFFRFNLKEGLARPLMDGRTMKLYADEAYQRVWVGHLEGLFTYSRKDSLQLFKDKNGKGLPYMIYAMTKTSDGAYYFGSHGQGLWRLYGGNLERVDRKWDLPSRVYLDLVADGMNLWATTERGVLKIFADQQKGFVVNLRGSLPSEEVYGLAKTDRHIWISTSQGLTFMEKDQPKFLQSPPVVYLESLTAYDASGNESSQRELSYRFRDVDVQFSAVSVAENLMYEYRKVGTDRWTPLEETVIHFSALVPDAYAYEIRAVRANGVASDQPLIVAFEILPPIWLTAWFWIIIFIFIGGLIFWAVQTNFRNRLRNVETKSRLERQMESLRLQALRAQMNPHFVFNSLNAIQHLILIEEDQKVLIYLADFAKLIRKALENASENFSSLANEIEFLSLYLSLETLRFQDKVTVDFQVDPVLDREHIWIPPMVIQPFIENAFVHGLMHKSTAGELKISIKDDPTMRVLICLIEDNGIGRAKAKELSAWRKGHQSIGISNTMQRLEVLGRLLNNDHFRYEVEDLYNEAGSPLGTRVHIWIPYTSERKV